MKKKAKTTGTVKTRLRTNDQVIVTTGKDRGKTGRVLSIDRAAGRVVVEGLNMVKKAVKRKKQTDKGGITEIEAAINISNVQIVGKDGKKTRIHKKTGEAL